MEEEKKAKRATEKRNVSSESAEYERRGEVDAVSQSSAQART